MIPAGRCLLCVLIWCAIAIAGTSEQLDSAHTAPKGPFLIAQAQATPNLRPGGGLRPAVSTPISAPPGKCDITHDGLAGVADVQAMINQAHGGSPAVNDPNGDGRADVVDIQIVVNAATGGKCTVTPPSCSSAPTAPYGAEAAITSPANNSVLAGASVLFQWGGGTCVVDYYLYVGTVAGSNDIFSSDEGISTSATVGGLPTNGSAVYVRLWSLVGTAWQYADFTYTASGGGTCVPAAMISPVPNSVLAGSSVTFQWTAGTCVTDHYLYAGSALGGNDLYGQDQAAATSATVNGLPTAGATIFVRLWSQINSAYQFRDYTYTAYTANCGTPTPAAMTSPANNSVLPGSSVTFQWSLGACVTDHFLYVGTSLGANDLFGQDEAMNVSATVSGLPANGSALYARLWSRMNGTYQFRDYAYTASGSGSCVLSSITNPPNRSVLTGSSATFQWTAGTCVTDHYLYVGNTLGSNSIFGADEGSSTSATVNALPTDGSALYVRLWSLIGGAWQFGDYTYTASGTGACALSAMLSPVNHSVLAGTSVIFQWTAGTCVDDHYLYVGTALGGNDIYGADLGAKTSVTVSGLPANANTLYVRLWSHLASGWQTIDYVYTATGNPCGPATMTTPANHSVLPGASVTFNWTAGTCVTDHYLYIGTALGGNDIYGADQLANTSATVNGLPTNGITVYVRLWSMVGGSWQFVDYSYTAF